MQEIQAISCIFWSRRRDSNPRPLRPERNALPTALRLDFILSLVLYAHGNANIIPNTFLLVKPFFLNIASLSRIILSVYPIFPCFSHGVPLLFFISTLTCPRHFEKTRLFLQPCFYNVQAIILQ